MDIVLDIGIEPAVNGLPDAAPPLNMMLDDEE